MPQLEREKRGFANLSFDGAVLVSLRESDR
eukprot:COSAG03_NODE_15371_length_432_cov_31.780781_1_plen_29_part_10